LPDAGKQRIGFELEKIHFVLVMRFSDEEVECQQEGFRRMGHYAKSVGEMQFCVPTCMLQVFFVAKADKCGHMSTICLLFSDRLGTTPQAV